jgi:hypothetical protein
MAVKAKAMLLCAEVDNAGRYGRVELNVASRLRCFIERTSMAKVP